MKCGWKPTLGLAASLFATGLFAGEPNRVTIASSRPKPQASADAGVASPAAVSLDKPVALGATPAPDSAVRQTDFKDGAAPASPVIRAQAEDEPKATPKSSSIWGESLGNLLPDLHSTTSKPVPGGDVIATSGKRLAAAGPVATEVGAPLAQPVDCGSCDSDCGWCFGFLRRHGWCCEQPACDNCLYFRNEYLAWWMKGDKLPALVTSGLATDVRPGALDQPGTVVLFGGRAEEGDAQSGFRTTLGVWLDDCHHLALEGSFFNLAQTSSNFAASSTGTPVLARPFFNSVNNFEDAELVAFPNLISGGVAVNEVSRLMGAEANFRTPLWASCCQKLDFITGFRFVGLDDSLSVTENLTTVNGGGFIVSDRFTTHNRFYGGQLGLEYELRWKRWFTDVKTMFGLGSMHETASIGGNTIINDPVNGTSVISGGLLALSSNSGRFSRERFAFAPELTVNVGYQLCERWRCFVGYNILYLSNMVRPGTIIDRNVNTGLLPPPLSGGPAQPAFAFRGTDFWAQGINVGLEFRY